VRVIALQPNNQDFSAVDFRKRVVSWSNASEVHTCRTSLSAAAAAALHMSMLVRPPRRL
jgi:hypothetical protein